MKTYTNLNQSKKLAEILPLESADMHHATWTILDGEFIVSPNQGIPIKDLQEDYGNQIIPCWSLAALLNIIPYPTLTQEENKQWVACSYPPNHLGYSSKFYNNPIDACVAMIEKLHEQKLL